MLVQAQQSKLNAEHTIEQVKIGHGSKGSMLQRWPILGSNLYMAGRGKAKRTRTEARQSRRLKTSNKAIDTALGGGFDYGETYYITSHNDGSAQDMIPNLLASHLLSSEAATASIIDCTLAFDVRKLHHILQASVPGPTDDAQTALKMLDRLQIMPIFDHVGLTEAVTEVGDSLNHNRAPKTTIGDSEDEGEEIEEEKEKEKEKEGQELPHTEQSARNLLIVTNLTQILSPLIRTNYVQGQATLTSIMRMIGHLTQTHAVCVLVFGDAHAGSLPEDERLSMFQRCTMRSALGDGIGYLVDAHLYLHRLPCHKTTSEEEADARSAPCASVLEVVQDRSGRYGQWAAFAYDVDGRFKDVC